MEIKMENQNINLEYNSQIFLIVIKYNLRINMLVSFLKKHK